MSRGAADATLIAGAGALCAVGRGVDQIYASVRAGIGRVVQSPVRDRRLEPIRMALCPEDALPALTPAAATAGQRLPGRARRILRLGAPALREAAGPALGPAPEGGRPVPPPPPLPLFLGLPEDRPGGAPIASRDLVTALGVQSGVPLDATASQLYPRGRAAALLAVEAGLRFLRDGRGDRVLVGGADSHLDLALLAELDREGRLLGSRVADGFIPGEGAAFLLLTKGPSRPTTAPAPAPPRGADARRAAVALLGVGSARDPGHRYSAQPARGEGLAQAIDSMLGTLPRPPAEPIESTFAGFNGESFGAKEWGVARLRHSELFAPAGRIEHPADCFGDAGAATGALLLALAQAALARGDRTGPALVFASSDREDRACALVDILA